MPGITTEQYFALIRNFRRHSFLLLYLFGASPAVCSSFVAGRDHGLQPVAGGTLHLPHATSLRMGRLGYQSDAQAALAVSYNSLESYAASLQDGLTQPYPPYEAIGVRNLGGEYNQLATSLLQIENEFYGTIRPKRVIRSGERPLHALRERGVEYVEVRLMDLNPFVPIGITAETVRFLDVFLLHCLLSTSPPDTPDEIAALGRNQHRTAARGREPGLKLERGTQEVTLIEWGLQIVDECRPIAAALDAAHGGELHQAALVAARELLADASLTPSARVLNAMAQDYQHSFAQFTLAQSRQTQASLLELPFSAERALHYAQMAQASLEEQKRVEAADTLPFEVYRQQYLSPQRLGL
jgi:glutamate--cysteine ligase